MNAEDSVTGQTKAYVVTMVNEEQFRLLLCHLRGFIEVAQRNGKDLLIRVSSNELEVYYFPKSHP